MYTDEFKEQIVQFGSLGYSIDVMLSILRPALSTNSLRLLKEGLETPGSIAYECYETGKSTAQLQKDLALQRLGCSSEGADRKTFEEITKSRQIDKLLEEKFGV